MKIRALGIAVTATLLTIAVGCAERGQLATENGRTTIKLASSITGSSFLAVTAGIQQGIFEKQNVGVEVIRVKSTAEGTAALASGQANVAAMLTEGVISSRASGSDLKIVANLLTEDQHILYTKPEIESIEQFAGRKMAVVGPGSGTEILAKALLEKSGVDPASVQYIPSGSASTQMAALVAGQVDGAGLVPPYDLTAADSGSRKIVEYRDLLPNLTPQVFAATERTLGANRDAITRFLAAYKEAAQWVVDHSEDAIRILMADSQIDYAAAKDSYGFAREDYSTEGLVDKQGLHTWLDLTNRYGTIGKRLPTVDELYDPSYAQETP
jgi:NitT/TauT family transport system substrate-binding protein